VVDRISLATFLNDIAYAYERFLQNEVPELPVALQISEVAQAERARFKKPALKEDVAFWKKELKNVQPCLLPASCFAVGNEASFFNSITLPHQTLTKLQKLSNRQGVTLQMSIIAFVSILLHQLTGRNDIALKVHLSGRDDIDNQYVIAPLYRELVVRTSVVDPTFEAVVSAVKAFMVEALEHKQCPWIVPAALLEWAKWRKSLRLLGKTWSVVSLIATRILFRRAALYSTILAILRSGVNLDFLLLQI